MAETSDLNQKYLRQSDKPAFAGSCQMQAGFITQHREKPMATQQAKSIGKTDYAPPSIEGNFYRIAAVLNNSERTLLKRVREFTEGVIAPIKS